MITVCSACHRQFRINARQLSAAKGQVQCGFCGEQFNALDNLSDRPPAVSRFEQTIILDPTNEKPQEPQFEIPEMLSEPSVRHATPRISPTENNSGRITRQDIEPEFALELLSSEPEPRSRTATVLWSLGALLSLIAIATQLLWFNRDMLLTRYPQYLPLAKQFCERWQCQLVRERDLDAIVLVNRDVRDHPRYNDALLVNITIENQSDITQPYPGIQFMLYDNNGAVTAYRRLKPAEYLDTSVTVDEGLTPHLPLHLVLEVADTVASTVGFEFGFF